MARSRTSLIKSDLLREALDRVDSRGGTALYDAVLASADHLKAARRKESDTGGHRWRGQFLPQLSRAGHSVGSKKKTGP